MINQSKIEQSNVNPVYVQERQFGEELDRVQMETAVADIISPISNDQKRFTFLRKIPFVVLYSMFVLFVVIEGFSVDQKKRKRRKHVV